MITYQEFLTLWDSGKNAAAAVEQVVKDHQSSEDYLIAVEADEYDHQQNRTIIQYQKTIKTIAGADVLDPFAANNKLPTNLFNKLNTQRNMFSLGNGVNFADKSIKPKLGFDFDTQLQDLGYFALIHGVSFGLWNLKKLEVIKLTEFAPLYDEETSDLRAGIRFWQITASHPLHIWLYTEAGIMKFIKKSGDQTATIVSTDYEPYVMETAKSPADGERVIGGENYSALPIIPLWGSRLKQSTLVGLKNWIDIYDRICSGLGNDMDETSFVFWMIENAGGMDEWDLGRFLNRLKSSHIVAAKSGTTTESGESNEPIAKPFQQDIPYQARQTYMDILRAAIYENFSAFDVTQLSAAAKTATEIRAAYDCMRKAGADFQTQIIKFTQSLGKLQGIDETKCIPIFKEDSIVNEMEQAQMLVMLSPWLDEEQVIRKMPESVVSVDEIDAIIKRRSDEAVARYRAQEEELNALKQEQTEPAPQDENA